MEKLKANSEGAASYGIEETSPDALKNTPSNIARLEDVIEQCKGRQKYLAHTGSPSDGGDVRWYFCKVPLAENELAASVPHTEIVGKGDYFRFGMRDSLALEASFLQKEEELLSSWWKEYAECSEGPSSRLISSNVNMDRQMESVSYDDSHSTQVLIVEEERVGVPVKGGLYEVDLIKRHCFPVYWNGENRRVLRGHWFARKGGLDWLPLREDVAEQLEFAYRCQVWHRRTFQPSGLFAARIDLQGSTMGLHALFTGEDDTWEAWLNVDAYGFSNIMSLKGNGIKLRRGYAPSGLSKPSQDELRQQKEEEMDDYCSQVPVRHLVFMVHGIGQRLEKANLVDDVGNFRQITASLAELHLTSYQRDTQRVLFIPCQWRRGLKLGGESVVEKITLDGVKGLRIMLSATAHDVLYYMSPIFCQEIINSVSNQLNRLYMKFIKRNPDYDGKVSIYGHSLGSVLSYDILCHQDNLVSPLPLEFMYEDHVKSEESELDGITQLSERTSPSSVEDECSNSCTPNIEGSLGFTEEDKLHFQSNSTLQEKKLEDSLTALDCSAALDARNDFLKPCNQDVQASNEEATSPHESSLTEDSQKGDSCDMVPLEKNKLDSTTIISSGVPSSKSDEGGENKYKDLSDKDRLIKLLTEEVNALKDRVAELESLREDSNGGSQQGSKKVDLNSLKQPSSQYAINQDGRQKSYTPYINYTKLEFKVDTFFAVGSPLGVFLALRNIRIGIGKGQDYWNDESISEEIPACRQMFNIFHPFDPVAYRVEPLICKEYLNKRPVIIPYHKGGKRLHIGFQEFTEEIATHSKAVVNQLHHMRVKVLTACQSRQSDNDDLEDDQEKEEKSYGLIMMERLTGSEDGRIDHMLQDKTFEHPYISAIGAHTNYWRDHDTALFILKHLYRDIPEEPDSPSSSGGSDQKDVKIRTTVRFYQKDTIDEEFPLTFSDDIRIKEFSSKMRKALKKNR